MQADDLYRSHPKMLRNRPIAFVLCVALALAGAVLALYFALGKGEVHWILPVGCAVVGAAGLLVLIVWWLRCVGTTLIVTDERTILRRGLLARQTSEVQHEDVKTLEVNQRFLERLLGVGTIAIGSPGHSGMEIVVSGMPDPQRVAELIRRKQ